MGGKRGNLIPLASKCKPGPHLAYILLLEFFWFSAGCLFGFFGDFLLIWGFSIAIHTLIHHYFSSCFP